MYLERLHSVAHVMDLELQRLAVVVKSAARELLPEPYRSMKREEVVQRLEQLKRMVDGASV